MRIRLIDVDGHNFPNIPLIYNKQNTKPSDPVRRLQRWVNMRAVFDSVPRFEDYI